MPGAEELGGVTFDDVCGLMDAKNRLVACVVEPRRHEEALAAMQERTRVGGSHKRKPASLVIMHGPPGSGKTMLARAAASATGCPVVVVGFEDVGDKFYGETGRKLQSVLDAVSSYASSPDSATSARRAAARRVSRTGGGIEAGAAAVGDGQKGHRPVILFFDEADAMFPRRPSRGTADSVDRDNTKTDDRMVAQALRFIDGLEDRSGVVVVMATNRKTALDPALTSRASEIIAVPAPDDEARLALWKRNAKHLQDHTKLAGRSDGLTGRDIVRVCDSVERAFVTERRTDLPSSDDYIREVERRREGAEGGTAEAQGSARV